MFRYLVVSLHLLLVVSACATTGEQQTQGSTSETITPISQAAVTPTRTATITPSPTSTPTRTPIPTYTSRPTRTPSPTPSPTSTMTPTPTPLSFSGPDVSHDGIRFSFDPVLGAAIFVHTSSEGLSYTEFSFAPDGYCRDVGCVTVYTVPSFSEGVPGGDHIIDELQRAIEAQSNDYFPTVGAAILLRAQTQHIQFQNGSGIRAIVMRGQDGFFANNADVVYDFHGLSADGQYYVVVTIPIDAPILLSTSNPEENTNPAAIPVPELPDDAQSLYDVIREYNQEAQSQLQNLDASSFAPSLDLLDALVVSLGIESPKGAASLLFFHLNLW